MNIKRIKRILASAFGVSLMGLSQMSAADWHPGACAQPHTGPAPCVERTSDGGATWEHFNGSGDHADDWHGPFSFSGTSAIGCSFLKFYCDMKITSELREFEDENGWNIGIKILSTEAIGSSTCEGMEFTNLPWFVGDVGAHQGFNDSAGIPYPGPYMGNLGHIDFTAIGGLVNFADAHIHGVTFENSGNDPSFLDFASPFFTGSDADNDTGCDMDGTLYIENYDDVNIY